jgi:MEMO1 family protein
MRVSRTVVLIVVFILILLWSISVRFYPSNQSKTQLPTIRFTAFDEHEFIRGIGIATHKPYSTNASLVGAVVPHHMVASHMIAGVFEILAHNPPKTIVLIGPNHTESGSYAVTSLNEEWETSHGLVYPSTQNIKTLTSLSFVGEDEDLLSKEHSIGTIVPYISYFLPNSKVIPLALKSTVTQSTIEQLADMLIGFEDTSTVYVVSTDFSHYLPLMIAEEKDKEMRQILESRDIPNILKLTNDHIDSPPSLALLLTIMQKKGATKMVEFEHNNSGLIIPDLQGETTSYFALGFTK